MKDVCDMCNLRCSVNYPRKKVPLSPETCPGYKDAQKCQSAEKRMPHLAKFNAMLMSMGKEPIRWE